MADVGIQGGTSVGKPQATAKANPQAAPQTELRSTTFDSWENKAGVRTVRIDPQKDCLTVKLGSSIGDLANVEELYGIKSDAAYKKAVAAANGGSFKLALMNFFSKLGFRPTVKLPLPANPALDSGLLQAVILNKALGRKGTSAPGLLSGGAFQYKGTWHVLANLSDFKLQKDLGAYYIAPGSAPNTYAVLNYEQAQKLYPTSEERMQVFGSDKSAN